MLAAVSPAAGQRADVPAASATPGDPDAPNGGQWFAVSADPGEHLEVTAQVFNPAEQPQTVRLYLAELTFDVDGRPVVGHVDAGVGAWGRFAQDRVELPPKAVVPSVFTIDVPADAEPGDHVGAVVVEAESVTPADRESAVGVVTRTAARLYVTVTGDAEAGIDLDSIDVDVHGRLLPRRATVVALVRNTGRVSLDADVRVNGTRMRGADRVVSDTVERYSATVTIPVVGGRRHFDVDVTTKRISGRGPTASASATVWVTPWWVLLAVFLAVVAFFAVRDLRRRLA